MKKRNVLMFFVLFTIMICSVSANAAKLTKTQKQVKSTVNSFMKSCKKYDVSQISKALANPRPGENGLFEKNIYTAKFIRKLNKRFLTYSIGKITVKGKTAKVKVNITYIDLSDIFTNVFSDSVFYILMHPDHTETELWKYVLSQMNKYWNNKKSYTTDFSSYMRKTSTTLSISKKGKSWKIDNITKRLKNAIHCGYTTAYENYDWSR